MSRITTGKDKIPKNSILARIFGLRQGFKDKSCPGQEIRETRTRWHPCNKVTLPALTVMTCGSNLESDQQSQEPKN